VWSPDGKQIYLLRGAGATSRGLTVRDNSHFRIVRMSADGEIASEIATVQGIVRMSFGADGRLYYTEESGSYDSTGEGHDWNEYQPRFTLVSLAADGGGRQEHARFPFARHAVPSPDGRHVVIQEAHNLLLAPLPVSSTSPAGVPFLDRSNSASPLEWLTRSGGLDAHWIDGRTLEYIDGHRYHRYDVETKRTTTTEIRLRVPRYEPRGKLAFTGARILTMKDRRVLEAATLVVDGSRIVCVGVCDTKGVDKVIDAKGKTIIPGLFDAHAHPSWDSEVYRQHHPKIAIYPAYGVTTVFDPSADPGGVFPSADLIAAGRLVGPRVFTTGPALVSTGGIRPIRNYQDAEDDVKRLADWGAISIKQYTQRRRDQRQWIVEAARRAGTVGVTAERLNLYYDLGMIMDGQSGWEHPITEHPTYSDVARFVAAAGTNHTPAMQTAGQGLEASEYWQGRTGMQRDAKFLRYTPWREIPNFSDQLQRPLAEYPIVYWTETAKDILRAGGSVSAGAHSKWDGVGAHREIWTFATALTPMEALETATVHPARYLGLDRDLGTLEPGKLADFVVLDANPLDDIRNTAEITYVAQGGVLYDDETLDRLWPDPAPYGPRPWLGEGAPGSEPSAAKPSAADLPASVRN
jgi:hypothetical protein